MFCAVLIQRRALAWSLTRLKDGGIYVVALRLPLLWLEITGRCQLQCVHCYADSGPAGSAGTMTVNRWLSVLDEAAQLQIGLVQFIGGEPTLHPGLPDLITHALSLGLEVEVFTNLMHVHSALWNIFMQPGVRLATSYYSDKSSEHDKITGRAGSHVRTRKNIIQALERRIPLRVGIIGMAADQQVDGAEAELLELGVTQVGMDWLREVGRGVRDGRASVEQLCGNCASGNLAISPDGEVWPCVFARWICLGNVRHQSLTAIHTGAIAEAARTYLASAFTARTSGSSPCRPNYDCRPVIRDPRECNPDTKCRPLNCRPFDCCPGDCRPFDCVPYDSPSRYTSQLTVP